LHGKYAPYTVLTYDYLVCNRFSRHFRGLRSCYLIDPRSRGLELSAQVSVKHADGRSIPRSGFAIPIAFIRRASTFAERQQEFDKGEFSAADRNAAAHTAGLFVQKGIVNVYWNSR
jgi:hypothetical protein